jgi:hypothetical protein
MTAKAQTFQATHEMPEAATVEGTPVYLYVLYKVEPGIAQAEVD